MNWIDIISITPFYLELALSNIGINLQVLRILRTARAVRMVKVGRYSSGIRLIQNSLAASWDALQLFAFIFIVLVIVLASAVYYTERGDYDKATELYERTSSITKEKEISPFQSIPGSVWWTIVTLVTVGYGDMQPVTAPGYVVGIIAQLSGVVMLALPLSIVGANFHEERERMKEERKQEEQEEQELRGALEAADNVVDTGERYVDDLSKLVIFLTESLVATVDLTSSEQNIISSSTTLVPATQPTQGPVAATSDPSAHSNTKLNQVAAEPMDERPSAGRTEDDVSVSLSSTPSAVPPLETNDSTKPAGASEVSRSNVASASDEEHRQVPSATITMCLDRLEDVLSIIKQMHEELE